MMRVPVDPILAKGNEKVRIFAPYHYEVMGMARVASRVPVPAGSAAIALEVFTREKIGVEGESLADSFLLSVLRGRLKENVVHFRTITEAAKALREDSIAAIMAPRGELEGALAGDTRFVIDEAKLGELNPKGWPVGMAVKAESADLAAALSGALAELQKDGTVAAIFKKHGVTLQTH
jgi:ABC-type amino acid transport substrate-binding protein